MKNFYLLLIIVFSLISCSKDLGSYDYSEVNTYEISGINTGTGISRNYNVVMGQKVTIEPVIESSMEGVSDNLSYLWIVEKDTVSKERDFNYEVTLPIGLYQSQFVLIDNNTGLSYGVGFALNVTSPFGRGYFFLNQDEENNTVLSFKGVSDEDTVVVSSYEIDGVSFGKFPKTMSGVKKYKSGPNDYSWQVYIVSEEGEYPVIFADLTSYSALKFFNKNSYMGTWGSEYEFNPTHVDLRSSGRTYFISNGKVSFFDDYNLYRHSLLFDNTPDYELEDILIGDINRFSGIRSLIGFDKMSSKFKVISSYPESDPEKGIVYNNSLLDRVLEVESPEGLFDNHKVAGAYSSYISSTGLLNSKVFTISENTIHLSEFNTEFEAPYVPMLNYLGSETIQGLTEDSPLAIFEDTFGDAYVATGTKVHKSSMTSLGFGEYLEIDAGYGEITALKYQTTSSNSEQPRLFIATYDANSSHELKGSILIYDVNTKKAIHEFKNVTNKVVDIFLGE